MNIKNEMMNYIKDNVRKLNHKMIYNVSYNIIGFNNYESKIIF